IIVWALGIDISSLLVGALRVNFLLVIVVAIWSPVDAFLNFAGPILFLYGLTKIMLRGSQKFQEWIVSAGRRFFGSFGTLATRNVKRNPARNAALVFVISLIVSYGIYSVGALLSEQDRAHREDLFTVGSDVSGTFSPGANLTSALPQIEAIDGVTSLTVEYRLSFSTSRGSLPTRGIDAEEWLETAYYEPEWFVGSSFSEVMQDFTGNKILLSISVARQLSLRVGNNMTVFVPGSSTPRTMKVVGLVGFASVLEEFVGQYAFGGSYPSYVPRDFLESAGVLGYAEQWVLVKTAPGHNGTAVEEKIVEIADYVSATDSVTSRDHARSTETSFATVSTRANWVGIAFALVLASVGTGLVVSLTLKEKEYETTLLSVRGFTASQVLKALLAEVMVLITFSLILGLVTGLIQIFGNVSSGSQQAQALVRPRMVFDLMSVSLMSCVVLVVVVCALIPILVTARFDEKKIDVLRE
ncbi:MAG: hypothetical protein HXY34_01500, partial [Candidatus Thorarchaeota archaeon]|nr:hypothetical protein [Candidatus Thorarchaeota archaeon]